MFYGFIFGMSTMILYKSYFELKELTQPDIVFIDNKGFSLIYWDIIKENPNNNW